MFKKNFKKIIKFYILSPISILTTTIFNCKNSFHNFHLKWRISKVLEGEKISPVLPLSDLFSLFLYGYHKVKEIKESQGNCFVVKKNMWSFNFFF